MKVLRAMLPLKVALITSGMLPILLAADDSLPEASPIEDEFAFFMEIPSVYSASKYEQSASEAPAWVTVITAEEISRFGYRTLADILDSVAGFYSSYDRNYSYAGSRGFGLPGDYSSRLLLLLDGARTNEGLYGSASIGRELLVDVDLIDRVEVTRGPGSSLYGSNAFFGVINIITKNGRDFEALELSGTRGSQDYHEERVTYGARLNSGVEILLSGTTFQSDGDDYIQYPEFAAPSVNSDDEESDSLFAELIYKGLHLQGSYVSRDKRFPTGSWETENTDNRNRTEDETLFLQIGYDHVFANNVEYNGKVFYQRYNYDGYYVFDYAESPQDPPDIVVNRDTSKSEWWKADGQLIFNQLDRHTIVLGGQFQDSIKLDQSNFDIYGTYMEDDSDTSNWGVYTQDEIYLSEKYTAYVGFRYDDYKNFGTTLNPRLSLVYKASQSTTLKLLYGTAFRAPNAYETNYHDGYYTTKPSVDLEAEEIATYELLLEQHIGENIRAVASLYHYKLDHLIQYTTDPSDELLVFENSTDPIEANGLELEIEGRWKDGYKARLGYTLQETEDNATGEELSNSPRHLLKGHLIAPVWSNTLYAGLEVNYTGDRDAVRGAKIDSSTVVNLTMSAPKVWGKLNISGGIYNALDEDFEHPGSEEHVQDGIEQDGRLFRIKLTYPI